jgi:uncharacterized protein
VASRDVFVLAELQVGSTDPAILAQADQTDESQSWYNGDDAVVLRKVGAAVDVIGQVGYRPTGQWGVDTTATQDNTIRRLPNVCAGDTNPGDSFDPAVEWVGYAANTFDGLGAHTSDCLVPPEPADPIINEFSADTVGDDYEYAEIFGDPDTDYAGYTLLEIEGDDARGMVDEVVGLGTTDSNGYLLMGLTTNSLGNGTLTLLVVDGPAGDVVPFGGCFRWLGVGGG